MALAEQARGRMRAKIPALRDALEGRFGDHHALLIAQLLARIDHADETIDRLSVQIAEVAAPWTDQLALLVTIAGVSQRTAEVILAEGGPDMDRFPSAAHLASWAGMCPGNNESAGKHHSGKTRKGPKWLRKALVEAAHAAARSKHTYLAAQYARIRGRRGPRKAAVTDPRRLTRFTHQPTHPSATAACPPPATRHGILISAPRHGLSPRSGLRAAVSVR